MPSFKITQSIAVVRIESRLDYALAAAIWDRLLDLPSGFFRQFGAGDLAERAGGINAIRGVISRAGVSGVLGAFSSVAYIVLMLTYNVQLDDGGDRHLAGAGRRHDQRQLPAAALPARRERATRPHHEPGAPV